MKKLLLLCLLLLCLVPDVFALVVHDVTVEPTAKVGNQLLHLNGYGLRKKFFIPIYLGSFYTAQPVTSTEQALRLPGAKLIRMNFIYHRADYLNVLGAFAEDFANNSPKLAGSPEEKAFLSWFKGDFVKGDVVDLAIDRDGTVTAYSNFNKLGSLHSPELAKGILLIYLGEKPASKKLKTGLLQGHI